MLRKVSSSKIKSATTSGASTGGSTWYPEPDREHSSNIPHKSDVDGASTSDEYLDTAHMQKLQKIKGTYIKKIKELQNALRDEHIAKDEIKRQYSSISDCRSEEQGFIHQNQSNYEKKLARITNNINKLSKKLENYQMKLKEIEDSNSDYTKHSDSSAQERIELKRDLEDARNNDIIKAPLPPVNLRIGNEDLTIRHRHHSAEDVPSIGVDQFYLQGDRQSDQNSKNATKLEALEKMQQKIKDDILVLEKELNDNQLMYQNDLDQLKIRIDQYDYQINDLTEIQQYEIINIKQELNAFEEKIEYHLDERTRDLQELLENCQTKISKLELQQHQQQQLLSMESFDNATFPLLLVKLINVLLAFFAVIFVLVNAIFTLFRPFFQSRLRTIISVVSMCGCLIMWRTWHLFFHTNQTSID